MKQSRIDKKILKSINDILQPLSSGNIKLISSYQIPNTSLIADAVVKFPKNIGIKTLVIECKNSGEPRIIRNAALQVKNYLEYIKSAYGIVVAPYISPQAAEICQQEGVGYLDMSGNCRFSFGNVLIEKTGKPNKFIVRREQRSLFSGKATRILRVLLSGTKKGWGVREMAKETNVSPGYVSRIRRYLIDREWLALGRDDMRLISPKDVLNEWAQASRFRRSLSFDYFTLKKPSEVEGELATYCNKQNINNYFIVSCHDYILFWNLFSNII